jgi:hypothetical protein
MSAAAPIIPPFASEAKCHPNSDETLLDSRESRSGFGKCLRSQGCLFTKSAVLPPRRPNWEHWGCRLVGPESKARLGSVWHVVLGNGHLTSPILLSKHKEEREMDTRIIGIDLAVTTDHKAIVLDLKPV